MSVCGGSQDVTGVLVLLKHINGSCSGNLWPCDVQLCAQSALVTTVRWDGWRNSREPALQTLTDDINTNRFIWGCH